MLKYKYTYENVTNSSGNTTIEKNIGFKIPINKK
jgi:hypothetical protein